MDSDFQQQYQAAEQAYGEGRYSDAESLATTLLQQLEATPDAAETRAAKLGWRAVVSLLLGHIALYGQQDPGLAGGFYQLVLDSDPQETLAELARQGLDRCQRQQSVEDQLPDLLQDPFINPGTAAARSTQQADRPTAMPWLDAPSPQEPPSSDRPSLEPLLPEPEPTPTPTPTPTQDALPTQAVAAEPEEVLRGALLRVRLDSVELSDQRQKKKADDDASASLFQRLKRRLRRSDRR